jgi:hypothetical protein
MIALSPPCNACKVSSAMMAVWEISVCIKDIPGAAVLISPSEHVLMCSLRTTLHQVVIDMWHHADNQRGEALVVYEGGGPEDPRVQLHLCFSGHIGDVPWTAVIARACGHSSFKGCPRCFQVGATCNSQGQALGSVRCLGYIEDTMVQKLEINVDVPVGDPGHVTWIDSTICYSTVIEGVAVFDEAAAENIRVKNNQHQLRSQGATKLMHDKVRERPMRARQQDETVAAWEAGSNPHHYNGIDACACSNYFL